MRVSNKRHKMTIPTAHLLEAVQELELVYNQELAIEGSLLPKYAYDRQWQREMFNENNVKT